MTTNLTAKNFNEFFNANNNLKVIAYGWSTCKPCASQKPYYEQLSELYPSFSFGSSDRNQSSVVTDYFPDIKKAPAYLIIDNDRQIVAEYYFIDTLADEIHNHFGAKENTREYVRAENREDRILARVNQLLAADEITKEQYDTIVNS